MEDPGGTEGMEGAGRAKGTGRTSSGGRARELENGARERDVTSGGGRDLVGTREPSRPGRTGGGVEVWVGEHSRVSRSIQASTGTDPNPKSGTTELWNH